ncbi:hypothetical protein GZH53_07570 [Flavihumibacter sp. R14]|nr:hypothetical protein [Flavihumibacter soli]
MLKRFFVLSSVFILLSLVSTAHKFYTSMTQVEYNSKTQSAEVIMNIFTDDLETALSEKFNRQVRNSDKNFTTLCYQYLDTRFSLKDAQGHALKNEYVGLEVNRDMISIYLEIKIPGGLNETRVKQVSLLEVFNDQTNIVNFRSGKNRTSLVFRSGTADIQTVKIGS